jgi:inner membrane transporter RhtA
VPGRGPLRFVPPSVLLGTGIVSVQVGAGIAGRLFREVTAAGMTGLRLWAAALMLALLGGRAAARAAWSVLAGRRWADAAVVAGFGLTLGVMNFSIYQAFARIPLGIAVTIEFLGPLAVAVASSRKVIDLLWVGLAGAGVGLFGVSGVSGVSLARLGASGGSLAGVLFALLAATSWACYILIAVATGRRFGGSSGLVIAMVVAAVAVTPVAVVSAGRALLRPPLLAAGLAIGLLSSVIPYRFELEALRRVPARTFGIMMSMEPAVAALAGLVLLGQALSAVQWLAMCCVIVASAGAARDAGRSSTAPQA